MGKMTKEHVLKLVATIGKKSAEFGCGSASIWGFHQPKQPAGLKKALKK
jgi:cyclic lactone autoinducer peptide